MDNREVGRISFGGQRFAGHALPLESTPELAAFQELVRETARWLYHLDQPSARRVPNGFDEVLSLSFRSIQEGSVVLPLEPVSLDAGPVGFVSGASYLERAIGAIVDAATAADAGAPLPQSFPRSALDYVDRFGSSLKEDEWLGIQAPHRPPCRYTAQTRRRLLDLSTRSYQDTVDVTGTVVAADVRRSTCTLSIADRPPVTVAFGDDHEPAILEALRHHATQQIRVRGRGLFSAAGVLQRIDPILSIGDKETEPAGSSRPIWETIIEMAAGVPEEESAKLPRDAAEHLDRYLYGAPKP